MSPISGIQCGRPATGGLPISTKRCGPVGFSGVASALSDAILKAKVGWTDGFDLGRTEIPGEFEEATLTALNRYASVRGDWTFHLDGGRDGGGWVESVANTSPDAGHFLFIARPTATAGNGMVGDLSPTQGGQSIAFDLRGIPLSAPMIVMSFVAASGLSLDAHVFVSILPDLSVRVERMSGGTRTEIQTSTVTVPATGWFKLDASCAISPIGNPRGGMVLVKLFTLANPTGRVIVKELHVQTNNASHAAVIVGEACGTCALFGHGDGVGISGIGMDDLIVYYGTGSIKAFLQDAYVGTALPADVGTHSESSVSFDDTGESAFTGFVHTFGDADRWKNVSTINPVAPRHDYTPVCIVPAQGLYDRSPFSGTWTNGEPNYLNTNGSKYNHFTQSQIDSYVIGALRSTVFSIICLAPAIVSSHFAVPWSDGTSSGLLNTDEDGDGHVFRPVVVLDGTLRIGNATIAAGWKGQLGYGHFQREVFDLDPDGVPVRRAALPSVIEVGAKGDASLAGGGGQNRFDVLQAALEYVYLKAANPEVEGPALAPIAGFTQTGGANDYSFFDKSIDWDGTIASRLWEFGIGGPTSTATNPTHHFATPGTYRVTLTVTDNDGLTDSAYVDIIVPNLPPVADFTSEITDHTVDFTDASTDADGTIVSRAWTFGDGGTSTATNPSHTYGADGTFTVTETVTDDLGATNSISHDVTVPPPVVDPGSQVSMPHDLEDPSGEGGLPAQEGLYGFASGTRVLRAGAGQGGGDCVEEGGAHGMYLEYDYGVFRNVVTIKRAFDLNGVTIPYETPLIQTYPCLAALTITTTRHLRVYKDNGSGSGVLLGTSTAPIAASGFVVAEMRCRYDNAGNGMIWVRINNVQLPELKFTGFNLHRTATHQLETTAHGTQSGEDFWAPAGFTTGFPGIRWDNAINANPTGTGDDDYIGDVRL